MKAGRPGLMGLSAVSAVALCLLSDSASAQAEVELPIGRQPFIRATNNLLGYELVPSFDGMYRLAPLRTNRWGIRGRDHPLQPATETFRFAFIGSSFTMGPGVPEELTYPELFEQRLNRESPGSQRRRHEVLNFAVLGYGLLQNALVVERKVFRFRPDAVVLAIHGNEVNRITIQLSGVLRGGASIDDEFVRRKLQERGAQPWMEEVELRRRIAPIAPDLIQWSFRRIAQLCREQRVPIVGVVFPVPWKRGNAQLDRIAAWADSAGIPLVNMDGYYRGYSEKDVILGVLKGQEDIHLNALGHRLAADRLYELIRLNDARLLKLGFRQ